MTYSRQGHGSGYLFRGQAGLGGVLLLSSPRGSGGVARPAQVEGPCLEVERRARRDGVVARRAERKLRALQSGRRVTDRTGEAADGDVEERRMTAFDILGLVSQLASDVEEPPIEGTARHAHPAVRRVPAPGRGRLVELERVGPSPLRGEDGGERVAGRVDEI